MKLDRTASIVYWAGILLTMLLIFVVPIRAQSGSCGIDCGGETDCWDGCEVYGLSEILSSTDSTEIDTYSETDITFDLVEAGYAAYVEAGIFQNNFNTLIAANDAFDDGIGTAALPLSAPLSADNEYILESDFYIFDPYGDLLLQGTINLSLSSGVPKISTISPTYGIVGTSGTLTISGSNLVDPFTQQADVSFANDGVSVTGYGGQTSTEVSIEYQIAQNASLGSTNISMGNRFGIGTTTGPSAQFTVGDPSVIINSVSPGVWQAGAGNIQITIGGSGFGTSPTLTVVGTGVALISLGTATDTYVTATISVGSNATGTATVNVQSNGYDGVGPCTPAAPNGTCAASYGVPIQAIPAPTPEIQLYGQTIVTTQSMVVGQLIALSATVNVPPGMAIQSQYWSTPPGIAIGGYTNAAGSGPPDTSSGKIQTLPPNNQSSFNFYWADLGGNSRTITYTYTLSNGESNSATATFNVAAPTSVSVTVKTTPITIVNPPQSPTNYGNPLLEDGGGMGPGMVFQASASFPAGNSGTYWWTQLVGNDSSEFLPSGAPPPISNLISGDAELDGSYPYGGYCLGQTPCTVYKTYITDDTAQDSPFVPLLNGYGEYARSFSAIMYLMWVPTADTRCNGSTCTIPVPLGSVSWHFSADAINSLQTGQTQFSGNVYTFPVWQENAGPQQPGIFQQSATYPTWSGTINPLQ